MIRTPFWFPWRSRSTVDAQIDAELEHHLYLRTRQLESQGLSADDARREAEREFGDMERTRAYCREQDMGADRDERRQLRLDDARANLRYGFRSVRRNPAFAAVTITTLAIAIGANTAVFSVANAILITPPPYGNADRVVALFENNTNSGRERSELSAADLVDYQRMQTTLTGIGSMRPNGVTLRKGADDTEARIAAFVSANILDVLGVRPLLGRGFAPGEDGASNAPVVVLGYDTWQRDFGGDNGAVGQSVTINNAAYRVIGVMPRGFGVGYAEDIYLPLNMTPRLADPNAARKTHWLYAVGRLKPGVTMSMARADLGRVADVLARQYPQENVGHGITVVSMQTALAGGTERTTWMLVGAALLVLLVACANIVNLMLARGTARGREIAVRMAIGAGRGQLVRQLITESVILAAIGGVAGIALSVVATRAIIALAPQALPVLAKPHVDWRVLAFTTIVSIGVGVVVGLFPALRVSRVDAGAALRTARTVGDRRGERVRALLVVSQTSLAVVLLVVSGLLVRSLASLRRTDLGFQPEHTLVAFTFVRGPTYQNKSAFNAFYDATLARLRATPGVVAAGASSGVPLVGSSGCGLVFEGEPMPEPGKMKEVRCSAVRGDFYQALGIPLKAGRLFDQTDLPEGPQVVVVNEAFVRRYLPDRNPLGVRIRLGPNPSAPWETIVGIVGDVRQFSLESDPVPTVVENDAQHAWGSLGVVVRTSGNPRSFERAVRAAIREADPTLAARSMRTMEEIIGQTLVPRRFSLALIGSFAVLALVLAAVGTYGVLAYTVTARTRELGIRMALGAEASRVGATVVGRGLRWTATGLLVGAGGAVLVARSLSSMLFGVTAADPTTLASVSVALVVVTLVACIVPARRALKVDPIVAMRAD